MHRPLPVPVSPKELGESCREPAPALLLQGIAEFNSGEYHTCHETLELLWRAESRPIRRLYQGILQVGIGFYKVTTKPNYNGAVALLERGMRHLEGFPAQCHGVDVGRLRTETERLQHTLVAAGREHLLEVDRQLIPQVHMLGCATCGQVELATPGSERLLDRA